MARFRCRDCGADGLKPHTAWRVALVTVSGRQMLVTLCERCKNPSRARVRQLWEKLRDATLGEIHLDERTDLHPWVRQFVWDPPLGAIARLRWNDVMERFS